MQKFRKKPVIVEAEQWWPGKSIKGVIPLREAPMIHPRLLNKTGYPADKLGWIETLKGPHIVSPGDWIVTGVKGEKYAVKPDIFEQTYEPVEEDEGDA